MSRKVDTFRVAVPEPLTMIDCTLFVPSLFTTPVMVQGFTFPTETLNSVKVPIRGQWVELPAKFTQTGTWTFDMPDNTFALYRRLLLDAMYSKNLFSAYLFLGNVLDVINTNNLTASLISTLGSAAAVAASSQVLKGCWIKDIASVEFNAANPTEPVKWRVSVVYNCIDRLF